MNHLDSIRLRLLALAEECEQTPPQAPPPDVDVNGALLFIRRTNGPDVYFSLGCDFVHTGHGAVNCKWRYWDGKRGTIEAPTLGAILAQVSAVPNVAETVAALGKPVEPPANEPPKWPDDDIPL